MQVVPFLALTVLLLNIYAWIIRPRARDLSNSRVLVIGGGVAGLTAAAKLNSVGFNVTLLEAMERIGGRTHTLKFDGQYTEMGGEWVHGEKGNSVFDLANPLGLLQIPKTTPGNTKDEMDIGFGFQTGEILNKTMGSTIEQLLEYISSDPENWGEDFEKNASLGDYARFILNRFNKKYLLHSDNVTLEAIYDWAHRVTNSVDGSDNWFELSKTDKGEQYVTINGSQMVTWLPPYSYSSLHQFILTGFVTLDGIYNLPEWIKLNTEVVLINYSTNENTIDVTTRDGTVYTTDHVIFTPSLGVLKATHKKLFQPQLSLKKQQAIEYIGFGAATKYSLEFENPWWPENFEGISFLWNDHDYRNNSLNYWRKNISKEELMEEFDGLPLWARSILAMFPVDSGSAPKIIRFWLTGNPSRFLDEMDPAYVQQTMMAVVHKFLDKTIPNIPEPIRAYQSKWASNPFTRGVYSYRTIASEEHNVWARDLAEPILHSSTQKPLLSFAGEATHPTYFSTVHGAYETGLREFNRIITWYSDKSNE